MKKGIVSNPWRSGIRANARRLSDTLDQLAACADSLCHNGANVIEITNCPHLAVYIADPVQTQGACSNVEIVATI
jgi:hypothetical protein